MKIDGILLARELGETLAHTSESLAECPTLRVFMIGGDAITEQYISIKKKAGASAGVDVETVELPETTTTEALIEEIHKAILETHGIVVQLPLPSHIDLERVRAEIPVSHDVDCLGTRATELFERGEHVILPPVVAAFAHIVEKYEIELSGKRVVVVGRGRLVGEPAAVWFRMRGALVSVVDEHTPDISVYTHDADIIALGAGAPHLLKPSMIGDGVVILDAGTSESGGKVVGDMDSACAEKASLYTPVPGGIGPLAVMMVFVNLCTLGFSGVPCSE